jgi:hypothetical protein
MCTVLDVLGLYCIAVDVIDILVIVNCRRRKMPKTFEASDIKERGMTCYGCALKRADVFRCTDKLSHICCWLIILS